MAITTRSFEGIQTWARQCFPDDFDRLPSAASFGSQLNTVPGYNSDVYFKSLVIGTTCNKKGKTAQIIAWLEGSHVKIGYIGKDRNGKQQIRSMATTEEHVPSWSFKSPFMFVLNKRDEVEIARFGAMLRYYLLAKGWEEGVIDESEVFNRFEAYFPHACRAFTVTITERIRLDVAALGETSTPAQEVGTPKSPYNYDPMYQPRNPHGFKELVNSTPLARGRSVTVLSSPSPSPPPDRGSLSKETDCSSSTASQRRAFNSQRPSLEPVRSQQDVTMELEEPRDADDRENGALRKNLLDLTLALMIAEERAREAEGLARKAEAVAQKAQDETRMWKRMYEEAAPWKLRRGRTSTLK